MRAELPGFPQRRPAPVRLPHGGAAGMWSPRRATPNRDDTGGANIAMNHAMIMQVPERGHNCSEDVLRASSDVRERSGAAHRLRCLRASPSRNTGNPSHPVPHAPDREHARGCGSSISDASDHACCFTSACGVPVTTIWMRAGTEPSSCSASNTAAPFSRRAICSERICCRSSDRSDWCSHGALLQV